MKGLLLKDRLILWKQSKVLLVFIIAYALLAAASDMSLTLGVVNVFLGSMAVKTVMAYEEQNKWNHLAAYLPVTARALVVEKYLVGLLCVLTTGLVTGAAIYVGSMMRGENVSLLQTLLFFCSTGALMLSAELPVLFKFGVNNGRLWLSAASILICGAAGALGAIAGPAGVYTAGIVSGWLPLLVMLAAAVVAVPASIRLSAGFYGKREF